MHNALTFGSGIGNLWPRYSITLGIGNRIQILVLQMVTRPSDSITFGAVPVYYDKKINFKKLALSTIIYPKF